MSLKSIKFKTEFLKRQKYNLFELNYKLAKGFFMELRFPIILRFFFYKFFINNFKNSVTKFNNICLSSGNMHSVNSLLRMNRLFSKNILSFAKWSGIRKSSW
jgi:hypothetical protein